MQTSPFIGMWFIYLGKHTEPVYTAVSHQYYTAAVSDSLSYCIIASLVDCITALPYYCLEISAELELCQRHLSVVGCITNMSFLQDSFVLLMNLSNSSPLFC
jgi:hypothetical protein